MSDTDFALRQSMIESGHVSALDTALHNAEDLPVPPLNDPEEDVEVAPAFTTGVFYVMAPHYQSEIVQMHLPSPCDLQTILNEARRGLNALRMRFSFRVLPTFPQLGSDYASLLVVPVWLDVTSMQVIVWDFRALGGPVYAAYCWNAVTYGDCIRESRRHGFHDWQAFVNGHSQALIQDASFVAVPGGVVQFQPPGAGPVWRGTLAARLDRPNSWNIDPDLPEIQVERPLLILHHEQVTLYTSRRFPVPGTRTFISSLVERTPDTALIVAPPGNFLTNVDYYGVTCRDVLAVYPLTPSTDRDCIIVFLDPRQTGNPLAHILLPERRVAPAALARFLSLRPPVCHKIAFWPRPAEDGMLVLSEGDTVVFGYIDEAVCSDDSSDSISDSSDDSDFDPDVGRGEGAGPSGSAGPDGGPSPANEGGHASSRSRSPQGRFRGHSPAQDSLRLAPLAVGTGLLLNACPTAASTPVSHLPIFPDGQCIFSHLPLAICCALGVALWSVAIAFFARQVCASFGRVRSLDKARTCKLLVEPTGDTPQAQNCIDTLRSLSFALGGPWMPRPFWRAGMLPPEDMVPDDSDEGSEPQICAIHCVVLKHTYCPESLTVEIPLPATQDELQLAVQHARTPQVRERFPVLSPVLPQRGEGTAIFTARPVWGPGYCSVCLDSSAIDGRIFLAYTLEYASKAELIRLSHLPANADPDVWVGFNDTCLSDTCAAHLSHGMLVRLVPRHAAPPTLASLGVLLLNAEVWGFDPIFPLPVVAGAYCLACRDGCRLFLADLWQPTRYRQHIADSAGVCLATMRIFAARPQPMDVSLDGVPCVTALAVGEPPRHARSLIWHLVLLDCRPLEDSWQTWYAYDGFVDVGALLHVFNRDAPLGWRTRLADHGQLLGQLYTVPGQILVLYYEPSPQDGARDMPLGGDCRVSASGHTPSRGLGDVASGEDPSGAFDPSHAHQPNDLSDGPSLGVDTASASAVEERTVLHFLLLAQGFISEPLSVEAAFPLIPEDACDLISASREARGGRRFPRLLLAPWQPAFAFACVLALPYWEIPGVPLLIACYLPPVRLMTVLAPANVSVEDILLLSGIGAQDVHVYFSDQPWALRIQTVLAVAPGDLITIFPNGHPRIPPVSLSRILASPEGWSDEPSPLGPYERQAWILTSHASHRVSLEDQAGLTLREVFANHIWAESEANIVLPAVPALLDHEFQGIPSTQVFLAAPPSQVEVYYFLDLRPTLSGITLGMARGGRVDVAEVCLPHRRRCPFGFCLRLFGGTAPPGAANHVRYMHPGQVLTIEFHPTRSSTGFGFHSVDFPGGDDDDEAHHSDTDSDPDEGAQDRSVPPSAPLGDEGTGSTASGQVTGPAGEVCCPRATSPGKGKVVTWNSSFLAQAYHEGTCRDTSAPCPVTFGQKRSAVVERLRLCSTLIFFGLHWAFRSCSAVCSSFPGRPGRGPGTCWVDFQSCDIQAFCGIADMWCLGLSQDVLPEGSPGFTPVSPQINSWPWALALSVGRHIASVRGLLLCSVRGLTWICLLFVAAIATWLPRHAGLIAVGFSRSPFCKVAFCLCLFGVFTLAEAAGTAPFEPSLEGVFCRTDDTHRAVMQAIPRPLALARRGSLPTPNEYLLGPAGLPLERADSSEPIPLLPDEGHDGLYTLLDESVGQPESAAFYLACTLLETLEEHFRADAPPKGSSLQAYGPLNHCTGRHVIRIADVLGGSSSPSAHAQTQFFDLTRQSCSLPGDPKVMQAFFAKVAFDQMQGVPPGLDKPQRFAAWTAAGSVGRSPSPMEELILTSDGSFRADNLTAGWGLVVSLRSASGGSCQFVGCLFGSLAPFADFLGGSPTPDAYDAEAAGLLWGAVVLAQLPFHGQAVVKADNISALWGVEGTAQMRNSPLCIAARSLHAALGVVSAGNVRYEHVRGHSGEPANELADALAALGAAGRSSTAPFSFPISDFLSDGALVARWMPHLAMSLKRAAELPPLSGGAFSWDCQPGPPEHPPDFSMRPFLRAFPEVSEPDDCASTDSWSGICIATFNVLSLMDGNKERSAGLHGVSGRPTLLQNSLVEAGVHMAGLQECRTPPGTMRCGRFTRYSSGCDENSCFGNELWICASGPCDPTSVVVLHTSPTVLIANARIGSHGVHLFVGHAPHRGHTLEVRKEWWRAAAHLCHSYSRQMPWLFFLDGNCRLGSRETSAVGSHQADEEDDAGTMLNDLLLGLDLCVPSTFASCMVGDGGTLFQKRSGTLDRSDFVCVPRTWMLEECKAWVEPGISAGHACMDHFAVVLRCNVPPLGRTGRSSRAVRLDAKALCDPANRSCIESIIDTAPRPQWNTDVSEHAAVVVDYLYDALSRRFPLKKRRLRASFFSEETCALHRAVAALRHAVRARTQALRHTYLRCVWLAWRSPADTFDSLFGGRWLWDLRTRLGHNCLLLRRFGRRLRTTCKSDKVAHLSSLSDEIARAPYAEVHRAVQRVLRPRKYRKASSDPLPKLHKPDGSLCQTSQEVADTWREHFRILEGGVVVDAGELVRKCRASQVAADRPDALEAACMPSWQALESAFRHSAPRKASGPDLIPPSICRAFSVSLTELFWPLLLKSICYAAEPAGMKGGVMFHIDKGKPGSRSECSAHRGILAQSCLSKVFHRSLRGLVVDHWSKNSMPLQVGGKTGCSAAFGHLCSRSVLSFARASHMSAGLLFVDLQSAYYAVIRETVLGGGLSDRPIEVVAGALGLDTEDLQLLRFYAEQEPILHQQNAGPLLVSLARELHRQTWFVLAEDPRATIIETQRGTRPGGTLADVLFNVLFAKVLARRRQSECSPLSPCVPWNGVRTPFPDATLPCDREVRVTDIAYADDLCTPVVCQKAAQLRGALSSMTADTMDVLTPHALRPNMGLTKTAAVFAPLGPGSRQARQEAFVHLKGRVPIWPDSKGLLWLDLVPRYRHLGSLVAYDGRMGPEIRHRLALAASAFREGKRKLFACKAIPLQKRAMLFRTHVLSVLMSGAGTWPMLAKGEWQSLKGGVLGFYRQLSLFPSRLALC